MYFYSKKKVKVEQGEVNNWKIIMSETQKHIKDDQVLKTNIKWCIDEMEEYL